MYQKRSVRKPTTDSLQHPQSEQKAVTRAIGYVRVSTEMQAHEGVSLDAQRERIRAYCSMYGIRLLDIISDDVSAKSLERPGLRQALARLDAGKANAIVVVKLDRLTRSVLDLGVLLQKYFLNERIFLLSVSESLDTRNAMGRFVLYILALIAQWEREAISERTRDAMQHLKSQGVKFGRAPYGFRYKQVPDTPGRRILEPVSAQQAVIAQILKMTESRMGKDAVCVALNAQQVPSPFGKQWNRTMVYRLLKREGKQPARMRPYRPRNGILIRRDKSAAADRARILRAEGLSLRAIGQMLIGENLYPPLGEKWHAANVSDLLRIRDRQDAAERAAALRAERLSLREVGRRLLYEGYLPPRGGFWDPKTIAGMVKTKAVIISTLATALT